MRYKNFGTTGLKVSEVGFGGSRIGGVFAQGNARKETLKLLHRALDEGITFFDTADMYAQGESEALMGEAFRGRRDRVVIAGKGGYCLPAQRKLIARIKPLVKPLVQMLGLKRRNLPSAVSGSLAQDFSAPYLTSAIEGSLRRLKTDYLDIYQVHSPPAELIRQGEFIETLERLKAQGKIRFYGVAADSAADALLALEHPGVSTVQAPFGLLDPEALDPLLPRAAAQGVAVIARGCFGGGLLKDSLSEQQLKELTSKWEQILRYRHIAQQHGRPILEMALQFVLKAPAVSVAILGMYREDQLRGNLAYLNARPLSDAEYEELVAGTAPGVEAA